MKKVNLKTKRLIDSDAVYVAVRGISYGDPERRVEADDEVSDLPAESIEWLLEQGHIKPKEEVES